MSVRMRQFVERQIIGALVADLLADGHKISVDNGDDFPGKRRDTYDAVMKELNATDDDTLIIWKADAPRGLPAVGWVKLVYGNNGPDVISDYTTNLEPYMVRANKLSDYWDADGEWEPIPFQVSV